MLQHPGLAPGQEDAAREQVTTRVMTWQRWVMVGVTAPVLTFFLWSCNSHSLEKPKPNPTGESAQYREINPIRKVDILFVVDNSGSMSEEQANLARNFPIFMDQLTALQGGDFHIASVSTDLGGGAGTAQTQCNRPLGDKGIFCNAQIPNPMMPGTWQPRDFCQTCGVNNQRFLQTVNPNFAGNIRDVFSCMARFGTAGCGFEHSTEALRLSLDAPENAGFLREDAYLAFILITDEEDCSAPADSQIFATATPGQDWSLRCYLQAVTCNGGKNDGSVNVDLALNECQVDDASGLIKVQDQVDRVVAKKGDPNLIIAAGIFGWPLPGQEAAARYRITGGGGGGLGERGMREVCASQGNGSATPGYRVKRFIDAFPNHSTYSICQNDFSEAMRRIGEKIRATVGPPCVDRRLVDTDPNTPQLEEDCNVMERTPRGDGTWEEKVLPRCSAGRDGPCWKLTPDAQCTLSSPGMGLPGYLVDIDRKGEMPVEGTQQSIRCLTVVN
jgi:hypothetical protein